MEYELLLLGLLSGSAMHGYQLNELIERRLPSTFGLKPSTAYSALDRLAARGLVTVTTERVGKRPERKVYALSEAGRGRFLALLRENLASVDAPVYAGEQGLLFSRALPLDEVRGLLQKRREATAEQVPGLQRLRDSHPSGSPGHLVARHKLAHLETELSWLDQVLSDSVGLRLTSP